MYPGTVQRGEALVALCFYAQGIQRKNGNRILRSAPVLRFYPQLFAEHCLFLSLDHLADHLPAHGTILGAC